jgi:hypothetical protein
MYFAERAGERSSRIDGPVLISAGHLSGFEFGPGPLNPHEQFKHLLPTAVVDCGVFVFDGHFEILLAAAISHTQQAEILLRAQRLPEALAEAQQAVAFVPTQLNPTLCWDTYSALCSSRNKRAGPTRKHSPSRKPSSRNFRWAGSPPWNARSRETKPLHC